MKTIHYSTFTRRIFLAMVLSFLGWMNGYGQNTIYANSSTGDDSNDGLTPATAKKTFTAAYNEADADDIIDLTGTFTWTNVGEVTSTTSGFTINKNIEIRGQGINQTIIQANSAYNTADRRVFTINTGVNASFSELTIRNGKTSSTGGAILNSGALSISKCNFINNIGPSGGGAIKQNNTAAVLTVNQSIFQ